MCSTVPALGAPDRGEPKVALARSANGAAVPVGVLPRHPALLRGATPSAQARHPRVAGPLPGHLASRTAATAGDRRRLARDVGQERRGCAMEYRLLTAPISIVHSVLMSSKFDLFSTLTLDCADTSMGGEKCPKLVLPSFRLRKFSGEMPTLLK